jgi:hypothetical protein
MANDRSTQAHQPKSNALTPERHEAFVRVFGEKFANSYMGPVLFIDKATLYSPAAINFFRRDFEYVSKIVMYEYQYRSWNGYDQDLLDRYAEIITKKLTSIKTLLENNTNRISKLLEQNNCPMDTTVYNNAVTTSVPIISGHARSYFLLLQDLDRLNLLTGIANLQGVIHSSQRAEAEFTCKKAVRAFAAALRNEVVRIYREADRMIHEQHAGGGGTDVASKKDAVAEQGKELKAFGEAMDSESHGDRSLDLGDRDPSQMIDEAAAASIAVTKAAKSRKKETEDLATADAVPAHV